MSRTAPRAPSDSPEATTVPPEIQARLAQAGLRRTLATRAVIGLFLARPAQGLTHAQVLAALASRDAFQRRLHEARYADITTEIRFPAPAFYYAEEEHQQYLSKLPDGYCGLGGTGVSCPLSDIGEQIGTGE